MSNDYIKKVNRDKIIKVFESKGLDYIGEFCVNYGVPLMDAYEVILEYTNDFEVKDECEFRMNYLFKFYKGK